MWSLLVIAALMSGCLATSPLHCPDVPSSDGFDPSQLTGNWKINYHTNTVMNDNNMNKCGHVEFTYNDGVFEGSRVVSNSEGHTAAVVSKFVPTAADPTKYDHYIKGAAGDLEYVRQLSFYKKDDTVLIFGCDTDGGTAYNAVAIMFSKLNELPDAQKTEFIEYLDSHNANTFTTWYHIDHSSCDHSGHDHHHH